MKVLFFDWFHWVYPLTKNPLKKLLEKNGAICKYICPWKCWQGNQFVNIPLTEKTYEHYKGFNLNSFILKPLAHDSKWYNFKEEFKNKYLNQTKTLIDFAYDIYKKERPTHIYIEGGLTYFARPLLEVARELNIEIISTENSFIKNKIFIEFNTGYVCNRHSFARFSKDWIETRYLTKEKEKIVDDIINETFKNLKYSTEGNFDKNSLPFKKTIFIPLQVFNDQVILYDSSFNNEQFIKKVISITTKHFNDWNIILKCHPTEERLPKFRNTGNYLDSLDLPKNYIVLKEREIKTNTQELIKMSDLVFVINSQAGLESCLLNKPVIVFGDAFYSKKGFTLEYNDYINWEDIKKNLSSINKTNRMKLWFYYFYKWLYNRNFTEEDETRIKRRLNLCN